MFELIISNLRVRPFRTAISIIGVAIGVVLVTLFTGLANGMTDDMARRAAHWKAELVFTRPGSMSLTGNNASLNTLYAEKLLEIEGVESTVPIYRYMSKTEDAAWGVEQIDGIEWTPFAKMNGMQIDSGKPAVANDEVIIDQRRVKEKDQNIGDKLTILGREFTIVGVFSPPSGARLKMSLQAMQDLQDAPNKCTFILVKLKPGADPDQVATLIDKKLPGNRINLTRDLVIDAQQRVPGLNTFLSVLVGLGAFVSGTFVLLSMYTTITERKKEIGILKSLGASRGFIVRVIEIEAFVIGIFGAMFGFIFSFVSALLIGAIFEIPFMFSIGWIAWAIAIAIGGSLIGALYPAMRASDIDPVLVLTNE